MALVDRNLVRERVLSARSTPVAQVPREHGKGVLLAAVEPWDSLVWQVGELLTDPKHFFRSFTVKELGRLMSSRPPALPVRAHEMGIYKRYFDLIATGRKTTEIRVNDSSRKKITEGSLIRFRC